jgi:hypothetical protein
MTFLVVFGSLMFLTVIYKKSQPKPIEYTEINLSQPKGSTIENIISHNEQLNILVKGSGSADRIIIYDTQRMQKIATINL